MESTMYHLVAIYFVVTMFSTCLAQQKCKYTHDCIGADNYRCCNNECTTRRYCFNNYCASNDDCGQYEYCIHSKCQSYKPTGYCDADDPCPSYQRCYHNKCAEYCDCAGNERCDNGLCVKKDSESTSSFSTSSIVGFTAVVVIGSCIACAVYCGCARRAGRNNQPRSAGGASHMVSIPDTANTERAAEDHSNVPVHPGGPPSYESLEMLNRTEELLPPPTYDEAVRNSHNNLSQSQGGTGN